MRLRAHTRTTHTCMCAHIHTWMLESSSNVFHNCFPPEFLRQWLFETTSLHWTWSSPICFRWPVSKPSGFLYLFPPLALRFQICAAVTGLQMGVGTPNSGPNAWVPDILTAKPSLQPQLWFLSVAHKWCHWATEVYAPCVVNLSGRFYLEVKVITLVENNKQVKAN